MPRQSGMNVTVSMNSVWLDVFKDLLVSANRATGAAPLSEVKHVTKPNHLSGAIRAQIILARTIHDLVSIVKSGVPISVPTHHQRR
jgi:hypothetical protein